MALLFKYTMGSDLTEWTTRVVDSGSLAWASGAGLGDTTGGASYTIDDANAIYLQESASITGVTDYRYGFYLRDVSLSLATSEIFDFVWVHTAGTLRHKLEILNSGGTKTLQATLRNDAGTSFTGTVALGATGATGAFYEVHVHKAATNSSSDAFCKVYKDGDYDTPVISLTGIDLFDQWTGELFRIGAISSIDASTSGVFYIDEVSFRNDSTQIGPNNAAPVLTVPGAQRYLIGVPEVISGISMVDPDDNESVLTLSCTYGTFAAPTPTNVDVSGSGTATMTLTGTTTELNAYCAAGNGPTYTHGTANHTADTITVNIDDQVGTPDEDTIAVTAIDWRITASTMADLNATLANLTVTESTAQTVTLTLYAVDSGNRTDTETTLMTFLEIQRNAGVGQAASIGVGISI